MSNDNKKDKKKEPVGVNLDGEFDISSDTEECPKFDEIPQRKGKKKRVYCIPPDVFMSMVIDIKKITLGKKVDGDVVSSIAEMDNVKIRVHKRH